MTLEVPLFSICIPTFNRADLLELCLATVLPQVEQFASEVECVISDNASSDRTSEVIAAYADRYPIRVFRNEENIGIIANITKSVSELARGEFALLIGDDDALCEQAIERILQVLRKHDAPDVIALNVGYLPRSERPEAKAAQGGVTTATTKTLRQSTIDGVFPFEQLLEGPCADFTASYSVVIRRQLWIRYFPAACRDEPFTSVRTTYPSGFIIASAMPGRYAAVISSPAVIIYEMPGEEYSWARYRALNSLIHATELLNLYRANGVPYSVLKPYYIYQLSNRGRDLGDLFWNTDSAGGLRAGLEFMWKFRTYPLRLLRAVLISFDHPQAPWPLAWFSRGLMRLRLSLLGSNRISMINI